jgi:hypothetical protein
MSLTASFWGSKVRKKIIREKSKIYKNSQNAIKFKKSPNNLQKKCLVMRIGWKMLYLQAVTWFYDFFLRKTKIFQKFIKSTKDFFGQNKKICVLWYWMINQIAKVSRILMNPRPILSDSSENDPEPDTWSQKNWFSDCLNCFLATFDFFFIQYFLFF